jgi:hypothetical protein
MLLVKNLQGRPDIQHAASLQSFHTETLFIFMNSNEAAASHIQKSSCETTKELRALELPLRFGCELEKCLLCDSSVGYVTSGINCLYTWVRWYTVE